MEYSNGWIFHETSTSLLLIGRSIFQWTVGHMQDLASADLYVHRSACTGMDVLYRPTYRPSWNRKRSCRPSRRRADADHTSTTTTTTTVRTNQAIKNDVRLMRVIDDQRQGWRAIIQ